MKLLLFDICSHYPIYIQTERLGVGTTMSLSIILSILYLKGYIIFPNIIDIAEKVSNMVTIKNNGKVEVHLAFTTVETAQLISIATSIIRCQLSLTALYSNFTIFSLAWNYSEYQSVRKNMLLDVTVSPFSRAIMFLYMLMQVALVTNLLSIYFLILFCL